MEDLVARLREAKSSAKLVGKAPAFQQVIECLPRIATSDVTALVTGETGTGKELVARSIHYLSPRAAMPFVPVNCGALPDTLLESELFGHERGAFTGATTRTTGLVEAASGGTLFLDELGDIPLSIQVKLLRLLETGTYRRVGSPELRKAEVRVVSATHRPLTEMVSEGLFRQDLFYRLNIFPIHLPPLRQLLDVRTQTKAAHILHHNEQVRGAAGKIVDGHDVGMVEPGRRLRLLQKALLKFWLAGVLPVHNFEGHRAGQVRVQGAVDCAHAAFPQHGFDVILI